MNEKQINKWLRKRFSPVGWTLVGYYVLMNILVSVAMLRDVIAGYLNAFIEGNDQYVPDVSALTGNAWGYIAAVAVALVILYAWKGREFWGGEVLRREKPMKPGTLLCMVCLCAGTQMVNFVWINLLELVMNCFGRSATGTLDAEMCIRDRSRTNRSTPRASHMFRVVRNARSCPSGFKPYCSASSFALASMTSL